MGQTSGITRLQRSKLTSWIPTPIHIGRSYLVSYLAYMHHGVPYRGAEVSRRPSLNLPIALTSDITKRQILQTHDMDSYSNPHQKKVSNVKFAIHVSGGAI